MKYELIITILLVFTLAIVPTLATMNVYAFNTPWYPNWDEDKAECYANGGYWKHAFCVYE